jgi:hypothetical protein
MRRAGHLAAGCCAVVLACTGLSSRADAAFCGTFGGTNDCGTQIKTADPSATPPNWDLDNGAVANSILNGSNPDREGMYLADGGGNINDSESLIQAILGNPDATLLAKANDSGSDDTTHGVLTVSGGFDKDGSWSYTANTGDSFVPQWLVVKADGGFTLWSIAGAFAGFWSTEGIVNNGGQLADLSHVTLYGTVVPLPGAALLFGSALAGLAWVRRRRGGEAAATA